MQYKVGQKIMTHDTYGVFMVLELIEKLSDNKTFGEEWRTNYGIRYSYDFEHSRRAAELQIAKLTEMLRQVEESK